jgi:hypothetical protein
VVGLGLSVGPLRRPFAAKAPLLGAEDWKGVRFRAYNSPVQLQAITALGATPVNVSLGWTDEVRDGTLRGAEFDLAQYAENGYGTEAGNVTSNVVLWPKVFVLSLSRKRFDTLTEQQQAWVREAARKAVQASVAATYDENALAQQLCTRGVHFQQASPGQLAGLQAALRPVLARLAADPINGPLVRDIQAVVARYPQPDVPGAAGACLAEAKGEIGPIPATPATLPDGIYRRSLTEDEVRATGKSNAEGDSGTWTLTVRHATYVVTCRPLDLPGTDCGHEVSDSPVDVGDLRGTGHTVYFVPVLERLSTMSGCRLPVSGTEPGHCGPNETRRATWALDGDRLTITDAGGTPNQGSIEKPWRKIN